MKITLEQLKEQIADIIRSLDSADVASLQSKLAEFFKYNLENYENLTEEAKSYVDSVLERLARAAVAATPEGAEKREMQRLLGLAEGEHFKAEDLLKGFESPSKD